MFMFIAEPNNDQREDPRGRDGHRHLVYVDSKEQVYVSRNNAHTHSGIFANGVVILDPAGKTMHTHIVGEMPEKAEPTPPKESDADLVARKQQQFQEAYDFEKDAIEAGKESVEFREGIQWEASIREKLEGENRAALTINHVAPMIETLSGIYRQNRTDIKVFPQTDGDQEIADALTHVIKQILSQNNFEFEEVESFEDLVTVGRATVECFPEFDTNVFGNIRVRRGNWDQFLLGPHVRPDASDMEYFFRWRWMSERQLRSVAPEAFNEADPGHDEFGATGTAGEDLSGMSPMDAPSLFKNPHTKEFRFMECEEKEYYTLDVYLDPVSGFVISDQDVPAALRASLKQLPLSVIQQRRHRLRKTILAGSVLIDDLYPDAPVAPNATGPEFSALTGYAYKRGPVFQGKVERAKDSQREVNRRRSQLIDIVNTCINNGWIVEEGTFPNKAAEEQFKTDVATAGFFAKVRDVTRMPHKVEAGQVQPGIVQLELASTQSFRDTTNVNTALLGNEQRQESGIALMHRQRQGLVGNEYLFDNMARLKKSLGRQLILWIAKLYTPDRLARLIMDRAKAAQAAPVATPVQIGGQDLDPQNAQLLASLEAKLKDKDLLAYDVEIGESGMTPTTMLANLQVLMEMAGKGIPLPPEALLASAPLPNKSAIMQALQQSRAADAAAEQKKYDTEIQKTMIAKGGQPPVAR